MTQPSNSVVIGVRLGTSLCWADYDAPQDPLSAREGYRHSYEYEKKRKKKTGGQRRV